MDWFHWHQPHHRDLEEKEVELLKESVKLQRDDLAVDKQIRDLLKPRISSIKVAFTEKNMGTTPLPPVPGPAVIDIGDVLVASVVGFDQFGQPWTGAVPTASFTDDESTATSLDSATNQVTGLAAGVGNITGSLTTVEGLDLTDTESVTVRPAETPTPVLTTIKVAFLAATPAASPAVRR